MGVALGRLALVALLACIVVVFGERKKGGSGFL
jgi:hypothetical protein